MRKAYACTFALCAGRHEMPVSRAIFGDPIDPTDVEGLYRQAEQSIPDDCTDLTVYVTGLTSAMLAVVSVCEGRGINLTAMHYNRETGGYYSQDVLAFRRCAYCGAAMHTMDQHCPWCGAT